MNIRQQLLLEIGLELKKLPLSARDRLEIGNHLRRTDTDVLFAVKAELPKYLARWKQKIRS